MREIIEGLPALTPAGGNASSGSLSERIRNLPDISAPAKRGEATPDTGGTSVAVPRGVPAPSPAYRPAVEYDPNVSGMDYAAGVLRNAPGSAMRVGENLYEALRPSNWDETGAALGTLGVGLVSKANTALGGKDRSPEGEAAVDAVWNDIKGRWEDPSKSFYEDPFGIGMDVASVAPVVGAAGRLGGLGPLATGVEKVASLGDPINLAVQGAKLGTKAVTRPAAAIARYPQAVATGVPVNALRIAEETGRSADAGARGAFKSTMKGDVDPREMARAAVASMEEKRRAMSDGYTSRKRELTTQELPMSDIRASLNNAMMAANRYGTRAKTPVVKVLKKMSNMVERYEKNPDAGARTAVQLDLLKRDLREMAESLPPSSRGAVSVVPKSVRDTIAKVDEKYADMMDYWQDWISTMRDLQSTLGTGDRVSETTRLARLMSTMKSGDKISLLKQLEDTPSGQYLKEMIAGAAFKDVMPPAMQGFGLGIMGPVLAGGPHGMAAAAAASPRLAGLTQYGLGRMEGAVGRIPTPPAVVTNVLSQTGQNVGQDRIERKAGGRVGVDHDRLADRLVGAAERAKKGISRGTEQLLEMPDDHIAHALELANRSI